MEDQMPSGQEPPKNEKDNRGAEGDAQRQESEGDKVNMPGGNRSGIFELLKAGGGIKARDIKIQVFQNTQERYLTKSEADAKQEKYRVGISELNFIQDESPEESTEVPPLPSSTEELNSWFYGLSDYEQCFVLAMTAFYGTSIGRVRAAAEELYAPLREAQKDEVKGGLREAREPQQRLPRTRFLKRLHIISGYSGGVDRLDWRDRDENGDSEFGTRLLLYIAKESALKFGAQEGQKFQEQLRNWVESNDEETAWHAARALGTFWCRQNKNRLYREVDEWAASSKRLDWHRAAWSLDGVYKIERVISDDTADYVGGHVLSKLRDWVVKARKKLDADKQQVSINLGSTAAITYAFLGRSTPDIGMNGLDSLLELPPSEIEYNYEQVEVLIEIYDAVVFSYTDLAVNGGRVREVLQHLADYVKSACYDRTHDGWGTRQERKQREEQRTWRVEAAIDILYWIADASLSSVKENCCVSYQTRHVLPAKPQFDDNERQGRDLLLEGILIEDEKEWRAAISTLLCAAFVERRGKTALTLLHRWAGTVMRDQSEQPDEVRRAYVRFMRNLGIQADAWCHQLQDLDVPVPPVATIFKNKLQTWKVPWNRQQDYIPLDLLAQEVLAGLPF